MFKHILIPTDGSELSRQTAQRAVSFAKEAGASVTVFFAKPEYPITYYGEGALIDPTTPEKFAAAALMPFVFCPWTPSRRPTPAIRVHRWVWPTLPKYSGATI